MLNPFRRKPKPKLGHYVIIDFSPEAKEKALGGDGLKRIYHMYDGYLAYYESYSHAKFINLMKNKFIIADRTRGQLIPKESYYIPETGEILGRIQISRML